MKILFIITALFLNAFGADNPAHPLLDSIESQEGISSDPALASKLPSEIHLSGIGRIAFRGPLSENRGEAIVLFHGIYGGASHRILEQELRYLDQKGFRVFVMDLPGVGKSAKPRRKYAMEDLDRFVLAFLEQAVGERAHLLCQGLSCSAVFQVAGLRPDLVKSVSALFPTGVKTYNTPPNSQQNAIYEQALAGQGLEFWFRLLDPVNIRRVYQGTEPADEAKIDYLIKRQLIQRPNIDQRWISLAFVFGQLFRPFEIATQHITPAVPVMIIGSRDPDDFDFGGGGKDSFQSETVSEFRRIRPEFRYVERLGTNREVEKFFSSENAKSIVEFVASLHPKTE